MRKPRKFFLWITIFLASILLSCSQKGWSDDWICINPGVFNAKGEPAHSFQEALFDGNYIYVVTFDSNDLLSEDPNRDTILWASEVKADPNEWRDDSQDLWQEVMLDGNTTRLDRIFRADDFVYAGAYRDGACKLYRFSDPNLRQDVTIGQDPNQRAKLRPMFKHSVKADILIGVFAFKSA